MKVNLHPVNGTTFVLYSVFIQKVHVLLCKQVEQFLSFDRLGQTAVSKLF